MLSTFGWAFIRHFHALEHATLPALTCLRIFFLFRLANDRVFDQGQLVVEQSVQCLEILKLIIIVLKLSDRFVKKSLGLSNVFQNIIVFFLKCLNFNEVFFFSQQEVIIYRLKSQSHRLLLLVQRVLINPCFVFVSRSMCKVVCNLHVQGVTLREGAAGTCKDVSIKTTISVISLQAELCVKYFSRQHLRLSEVLVSLHSLPVAKVNGTDVVGTSSHVTIVTKLLETVERVVVVDQRFSILTCFLSVLSNQDRLHDLVKRELKLVELFVGQFVLQFNRVVLICHLALVQDTGQGFVEVHDLCCHLKRHFLQVVVRENCEKYQGDRVSPQKLQVVILYQLPGQLSVFLHEISAID